MNRSLSPRDYLPHWAIIPLLLISLTATAEVYKWIDAEGNTHFSDMAPDNVPQAEKLVVPPVNTSTPSRQNHSATRSPRSTQMSSRYDTLTIISPQNDQAVRANDGSINVSCQLQPPLRTNRRHQIRFMLDGNLVGTPGSNCQLSLSNISRGAHTVSAEVVDTNGVSLIQSTPTRFHLLRHSRN